MDRLLGLFGMPSSSQKLFLLGIPVITAQRDPLSSSSTNAAWLEVVQVPPHVSWLPLHQICCPSDPLVLLKGAVAPLDGWTRRWAWWLGTEPKLGQLDELERPLGSAWLGCSSWPGWPSDSWRFCWGDAILMVLLQIQCHFGLAPIDVVAVGLDISWPQPLLLLTSFLLPFASLYSALGSGLCFQLGKGWTNCFCLQLLYLPSSPFCCYFGSWTWGIFRLQGTLLLFSPVSRGFLRSLRWSPLLLWIILVLSHHPCFSPFLFHLAAT